MKFGNTCFYSSFVMTIVSILMFLMVPLSIKWCGDEIDVNWSWRNAWETILVELDVTCERNVFFSQNDDFTFKMYLRYFINLVGFFKLLSWTMETNDHSSRAVFTVVNYIGTYCIQFRVEYIVFYFCEYRKRSPTVRR